MPLRRDNPAWWDWFVEHHAYGLGESAWQPAEFVLPDGVFDVRKWDTWVEGTKEEYEHLGHF